VGHRALGRPAAFSKNVLLTNSLEKEYAACAFGSLYSTWGVEMAETITVDGKLDDKPISHELKTKVQHALKGALEKELVIKGNHHFSTTHISIVYDVQ
jgi:hypothetical protein